MSDCRPLIDSLRNDPSILDLDDPASVERLAAALKVELNTPSPAGPQMYEQMARAIIAALRGEG